MSMTLARRSKRKGFIDSSITLASSQSKHVKILELLEPRGRECLSPIKYTSPQLFECCTHSMIKYNWYRVVPLNHQKSDDIAFSMGQSWDLVRILMVELGYIEERMGVDYVRLKKLQLLSETFNSDVQLHISDTHLKGEKNTILCV